MAPYERVPYYNERTGGWQNSTSIAIRSGPFKRVRIFIEASEHEQGYVCLVFIFRDGRETDKIRIGFPIKGVESKARKIKNAYSGRKWSTDYVRESDRQVPASDSSD